MSWWKRKPKWWKEIWERIPQEERDKVPGIPGVDVPPVTEPGPTPWAPGPRTPPPEGWAEHVPEFAKHPEGFQQYNIGDPIEFDALAEDRVSAVHVLGPPMRAPVRRPPKKIRDDDDALASWREKDRERREAWEAAARQANPHFPYRDLKPGDVTVRNSAPGQISGMRGDTLSVVVAPHDVEIAEDALSGRELKHLDNIRKASGQWAFGFHKQNVPPLKLEEERRPKVVKVSAAELLAEAGGSVIVTAYAVAADTLARTPSRGPLLVRGAGGLRGDDVVVVTAQEALW